MSNYIEGGGTFLYEAKRRVPEKIIINDELGREFAERNKKSESFLLSTARNFNPEFQKGIDLVKPMLIYGTVDPVGNASELLTMMEMSRSLGVPTLIILDDVCHDLNSCGKRIMNDSFELVGMKGKRMEENLRFDKVKASEILPDKILEMLLEAGVSSDASLAESYEQGLYLLAYEFYGDLAFENLAYLRTSRLFSRDSFLGEMSLKALREKVKLVAKNTGQDSLVFIHVGDKVMSDDPRFDGFCLADLYDSGGSLGGTAHVSITTMLLDREVFGVQTHPLILAEKDTSSGKNFASTYQTLLGKDSEENRIAVSGIRRIYASKNQSGGDGVDPLVLLYMLRKTKEGAVLKRAIEKQVQDAFPLLEGSSRNREIVLSDRNLLTSSKIALLKETYGIDGNTLMSMGIDKRKIGRVLSVLAEASLEQKITEELLLKIIKSI